MENINERAKVIGNLIHQQINLDFTQNKNKILSSLELLLNGNYKKYSFDVKNSPKKHIQKNIEQVLSKFNENTVSRKSKGTYYTPQNVTNYINLNAILMNLNQNTEKVQNNQNAIHSILAFRKEKIEQFLFEKTVFDPTCGSGEFLINMAEIKLTLLDKIESMSDENIINIAETIHGNDISEESIDIAMYRLFLSFARTINYSDNLYKIAEIIRNKFTKLDFINYDYEMNNKFDIIIGNPPYIEYSKYSGSRNENLKFGNVYADVLYNIIDLLNNSGTIGFVLPLSFSSTNRMRGIRECITTNFQTQFILSFADRPDCLFPGVHQKINILIAKKENAKQRIFVSRYNFWKKNERKNLLSDIETIELSSVPDKYIPKIGNLIEKNIFEKIKLTSSNNNIESFIINDGKAVFLNMRATFWIKAFSFNPGSKEYKKIVFNDYQKGFFLSLLNSSLFWMFWTIVSDGWHITKKELSEFYIPVKDIDFSLFDELAMQLEKKLEKTKKHIGSKQAEFIYQHKECKAEIDKIDNELAKIYGLTEEEMAYVKNYALPFRTGGRIVKSN